MALFFFRRANLRLSLALVSFLLSASLLAYMFRDSIPSRAPLTESEQKSLLKQEQGDEALKLWESYHATISAPEQDPPPDGTSFGDLIIAGQESTDVSWADSLEDRWTVLRYDADNPDNPDPRLRFPRRKGNEAVVYLSYLIDNYDTLPWSSYFVHGHATAWHQEGDIATLVASLDRQQLARYGYISLRCGWIPSCPAEIHPESHDGAMSGADSVRMGTESAVYGAWKSLFPDDEMPRTIASPCCAQFAVTRDAVRRRPKADYERLRRWLLGSLLDHDMSGRVLEKLWAYIFTGQAV